MVLIFSIPSSLQHSGNHVSGELSSLIRQQLLGKTVDGEEVVIQDSSHGVGRMVGGLSSLALTIYWPFGTLPFGLFLVKFGHKGS